MFIHHPEIAKRWAKEFPNQGRLPKHVHKKKISMSKQAFVAEHKELLKTLKHPTKKRLQKEYKEQSEELKRHKKVKVVINNKMKDMGQEIDLPRGKHKIIINKRKHKKAGKKELVDTLQHEKLHAMFPKASEGQTAAKTKRAMARMSPRMRKRLLSMLPK